MRPPSELIDPPAAAIPPTLAGPHGEDLAIVAEQVADFGGVERILATLMARYPAASVSAVRFDPSGGFPAFEFDERLELHRGDRNGAAAEAPEPRDISLLGAPGRVRRHYLSPLYAR